ncbi:zinc finger protein 525-like [Dermacentor albipictus]|uniref:zinc finger protein 525-like n=1 Tax=Dermacentor albipictus TaxID=60249 RepID=UPI0031FBB18D
MLASAITLFQRIPGSTISTPAMQVNKGIGVNESHKCNVCRPCVTHMSDKADASPICEQTLTPEHSHTAQQLMQYDGKEQFTCHAQEHPHGLEPVHVQRVTSHMLMHISERLHKFEKPYKSELGPSAFCHKRSLDSHKQLHAYGVDLCHCQEYGKTFAQREALEQHLQ